MAGRVTTWVAAAGAAVLVMALLAGGTGTAAAATGVAGHSPRPISASATWLLYSDTVGGTTGAYARSKTSQTVRITSPASFTVLGSELIGPSSTEPGVVVGLDLPGLAQHRATLPSGASYVGPAPQGFVYASAAYRVYRKTFAGRVTYLGALLRAGHQDTYGNAVSGPTGVIEFGDDHEVQFVAYAHPGSFAQLGGVTEDDTYCTAPTATAAGCFSAADNDGTSRTGSLLRLDGTGGPSYADSFEFGDPSCVNPPVVADGNAVAWLGCENKAFVVTTDDQLHVTAAAFSTAPISAYGHIVMASADGTELVEQINPDVAGKVLKLQS